MEKAAKNSPVKLFVSVKHYTGELRQTMCSSADEVECDEPEWHTADQKWDIIQWCQIGQCIEQWRDRGALSTMEALAAQ